jgi:hypothetical protein
MSDMIGLHMADCHSLTSFPGSYANVTANKGGRISRHEWLYQPPRTIDGSIPVGRQPLAAGLLQQLHHRQLQRPHHWQLRGAHREDSYAGARKCPEWMPGRG